MENNESNNDVIEFIKNNQKIYFSNHFDTDYIVSTINKTHNFYEAELLDWLSLLHLPEGDIVDAGANIGNHSIFFSKILKRTVWAFEPNKIVYDDLIKNFTLNNLETKNVYNKALGETTGHCNINIVDESNLGSTSVELSVSGKIEMVALDKVIPENIKIALIKIDVEGFEFDVLKGAKELILQNKPVLLIECANEEIIYETIRFLKEFAYDPIVSFGATPMLVFCPVELKNNILGKESNILFRRFVSVQQHLNEVNLKYRSSSQLINQQREELKKTSEIYEKLLLRLNYLETDLKKSKSDINILKKALDIAKGFKINFEGCRASASYQMGHLLLHETRSIRDVLRLPGKIKDIRSKKQVPSRQFTNKNSQKFVSKPASTDIHSEKRKTELIQVFATDKKTHELKIACIMDPFTYGSYSHEATFRQLTPEKWKDELKIFSPDLLFIESAWRGKDELWWNAVGKKCDELVAIVKYCNKHNIPTAFWNKEDPVHFDTFINTAVLFDFVFTTDIDIIDKYKIALQHDKVYLLPFACQPRMNNPIEKYERKDAFCFAGAYYVRYPDRTKDLDEFMLHLPEIKPIEIYDRNYGKNDPTYMFPEQFKPFIVGTLPFEEIDKAYKGYNYAINLNSVKQSQSMFARRVYEVLASNTVTVSNFSRAVRLLFGDLVITSDNGTEMVKRVGDLAKDELALKKHKLIALRKVLTEHTYKDRLEYLVSKVFNRDVEDSSSLISMICFIQDKVTYEQCLKTFDKQKYQHKNLLIITDHFKTDNARNDIKIIDFNDVQNKTVTDLCPSADYIAMINTDDYYGANYLTDLVLSTYYFDGAVIGKASYYQCTDNDEIVLQNEDMQYHIVNSISLYTSIVKEKELSGLKIDTLKKINKSSELGNLECLSIDEFNYCQNGKNLSSEEISLVEANAIKHDGISMKELIDHSEKEVKAPVKNTAITYLSGVQLAQSINKQKATDVAFEFKGENVNISSMMISDKHQNIYNPDLYEVNTLGFSQQQNVYLDMTIGLDIMLIVLYLDEKKQKISHQSITPNQNAELSLPDSAKFIQFGFRVKGPGSVTLNSLELEHRILSPSVMVAQADHLVLTNHYPSYDDLYRNGFVHARVKAYQEHGTKVDVFRLHENTQVSYHEFENVDVTTGSSDALRNLLENNNYKSILVHFLDEQMWDVIKDFIDKVRVFVWVHGAEVQPWTRRKHLFETDEAIEKAKIQSEKRTSFWKELLQEPHANLNLLFVSRYLANSVMEDLSLDISKEKYYIVHNFINTDLFHYQQKEEEKRKKILSIRPYANRNYANDLSVQAIVALSEKPYFKDLEFRMIGDGVLFDEILKPLKEFENVIIEKRFLTQKEIASLHKEYGIFLCPSRMDTHGVSRDEAMSAGLIPVTNNVTAIPEFVNNECGILAKEDDAHGLAEGITALYEDPELFQKMSKAAAKRVREQCSFEQTIGRELDIFNLPLRTDNKKKILIFGSCVSRDIFNLPNNFSLADYYARSSFASILQVKFIHSEIADQLESKFQRKIVKTDMEKSVLSDLKKGDFDILLLDFIDERFNLLSLDNTVCTLSNEAVNTGLLEEYQDHKIIKSGSKEFFDMWEQGWRKFAELMKENEQFEKVVLNKVYWAEETVSGNNFEPTYSNDKIRKMNKFLDKLYNIAEQSIPPENIMKFSEKIMIGADKHQWGLSPFHYVTKYYESALNFLNNLESSIKK